MGDIPGVNRAVSSTDGSDRHPFFHNFETPQMAARSGYSSTLDGHRIGTKRPKPEANAVAQHHNSTQKRDTNAIDASRNA